MDICKSFNQLKEDHVYHFRLTPQSDDCHSLQVLYDTIEPYCLRFIVSLEKGPHYHALMEFASITSSGNDGFGIMEFRKEVNNLWGTGNTVYSLVKAKNEKQLKKYCLKEGNYMFRGFSASFLKKLKKTTFLKKKEDFRESLTELEDQYIMEFINFEEFQDRYIELKLAYRYRLVDTQIKAYYNMLFLIKNPQHISSYNQILRNSDDRPWSQHIW